MLSRHIFLIGMPGSGKSSLGRKVSNLLHLPYGDMDSRIQQALGGTVTEIFEKYGEDAFRAAETNMLIQVTREQPSLVSTGGGLVMREINRRIMVSNGVLLLVDRPLELIMSDIKLDRRPLLAAKGLDEVERLYHERIDTYRDAADLVLNNNGSYYDGVSGLQKLLRMNFSL